MAERYEPGEIAQPLTAGAGVPNSTNNDCPVWLTSDGSRRAYALLKQRKDTGIIDTDGKRRHDVPNACDMPYPEGTCDKPEGSIFVTCSFLIMNKNKKEKNKKVDLVQSRCSQLESKISQLLGKNSMTLGCQGKLHNSKWLVQRLANVDLNTATTTN
jgi:hypothetical protein